MWILVFTFADSISGHPLADFVQKCYIHFGGGPHKVGISRDTKHAICIGILGFTRGGVPTICWWGSSQSRYFGSLEMCDLYRDSWIFIWWRTHKLYIPATPSRPPCSRIPFHFKTGNLHELNLQPDRELKWSFDNTLAI